MDLKQIGRDEVKSLMSEIHTVLDEFGSKHGLKMRTGGAKYTNDNFRFTVEAALITEAGDIMSSEAKDFKDMARSYGLDPEMLNKTFTYAETEYKVIGLRPRATKKPVICKKTSDGKQYVFSIDFLKVLLAPKVPA